MNKFALCVSNITIDLGTKKEMLKEQKRIMNLKEFCVRSYKGGSRYYNKLELKQCVKVINLQEIS